MPKPTRAQADILRQALAAQPRSTFVRASDRTILAMQRRRWIVATGRPPRWTVALLPAGFLAAAALEDKPDG